MTSSLELPPEPQSVRTARRWVLAQLAALDRADLAEAAALGVSELVTNAILHAGPPVLVRLGGTARHPRVEVHDNSHVPPSVRDMSENARVLATVGRGLGIVAMNAHTWGAEVSPRGKVVWFEPTADPMGSGPAPVPGDLFDLDKEVERLLAESAPEVPRFEVCLHGMPVQLFARHRVWWEELRRELRLLALHHGVEYPLAAELTEVSMQVDQERRQSSGIERLDRAIAEGTTRLDLDYQVPVSAATTMARLAELLDDADRFCAEQGLLTLAPGSQLVALRRWYLAEFSRQADGAEPIPWPGGYALDDRTT